MSECAEYLAQAAMKWRDVIGLSNWKIVVKQTDVPREHDEEEKGKWYGDCTHAHNTFSATIRIHKDLDEQESIETLVHELLHIPLGTMQIATNRIIDLVKPKLKDHAWELLDDALEPTVEWLAQAFMRLDRLPVKGQSDENPTAQTP